MSVYSEYANDQSFLTKSELAEKYGLGEEHLDAENNSAVPRDYYAPIIRRADGARVGLHHRTRGRSFREIAQAVYEGIELFKAL